MAAPLASAGTPELGSTAGSSSGDSAFCSGGGGVDGWLAELPAALSASRTPERGGAAVGDGCGAATRNFEVKCTDAFDPANGRLMAPPMRSWDTQRLPMSMSLGGTDSSTLTSSLKPPADRDSTQVIPSRACGGGSGGDYGLLTCLHGFGGICGGKGNCRCGGCRHTPDSFSMRSNPRVKIWCSGAISLPPGMLQTPSIRKTLFTGSNLAEGVLMATWPPT